MDKFSNSQRSDAQDARLALELRIHSEGIDHEVVLLDAANESDLRKTHRRYFESIESLARGVVEAVGHEI